MSVFYIRGVEMMETGKMLYEGKAKKMFETRDPEVLLIEYKNSLTAFNAQKKAEMEGKGRYNTLISAWLEPSTSPGPNIGVPAINRLCNRARKP